MMVTPALVTPIGVLSLILAITMFIIGAPSVLFADVVADALDVSDSAVGIQGTFFVVMAMILFASGHLTVAGVSIGWYLGILAFVVLMLFFLFASPLELWMRIIPAVLCFLTVMLYFTSEVRSYCKITR